MVNKKGIIGLLSLSAFFSSCQKDLLVYNSNDIKVEVIAGDEWKHPFELFLGIKRQNTPQIAVWLEDINGNYLSTLYVSYRGGKQKWIGYSGARKEALPYWNYARLSIQNGETISDGYTGATTQTSIPDAVTGATPKGDFDLKITPHNGLDKFIVKAEFNHSTDYNDFFPKSVVAGDANYSAESGQPAVIYEALIDLTSGQNKFAMELIGHSSPDGSDGKLYTDLSGLTTAKNIVKEIKVSVQK